MKRREFIGNFVKAGAMFVPAWAVAQSGFRSPTFVGTLEKSGGGGGGCSNTEQLAQGSDFIDSTNWSFYDRLAASFVTGGSGYTVCKIQAELFAAGTVAAGTLVASIYNDSSGSPGSQIGTASAALDRTTISGFAFYDFTGVSAALSSSTTYWVVLSASALDTNGSNFVGWIVDSTGESGSTKGKSGGAAWDGLGGSRTFNFKLFS